MTDAFVVGAGVHPFGRFPELSVPQLARRAIWNAIADSGADPHHIDIGYVANCYNGFFTGQEDALAPLVFGRAGLSGIPMIHNTGGGASGSVAFHEAVIAVLSGQYRLALAVGVEKIYVPGNPAISISAIATSGEQTTATQLGLTWVGDLAMSARQLMKRYGWTARDFAAVAAKNRMHGALNPEGEIRQEISVDDVLAARMVAPPLTRPMCAGAAIDGAAAVLVADAETAARLGSGHHPKVASFGMVGARYISNRVPDERPGMLSMDEASRAFAIAYERAGVGPEDIDLLQVHDAIAPEELLAYQVVGLCAPGEEAALVRSGATALGGRVPVNTDGGLIARGHPIAASGVAQVVETTRQLRGTAGARQVRYDGRLPRIGAIQNAGAQGGPAAGTAVSAAFLLST
jgi:acetyl-CoA acetyltransferase